MRTRFIGLLAGGALLIVVPACSSGTATAPTPNTITKPTVAQTLQSTVAAPGPTTSLSATSPRSSEGVTTPERTTTDVVSTPPSNDVSDATETSSSATETMDLNPVANDHGFIPKELGQPAGLVDQNGKLGAAFSITAITVDPPCTSGQPVKPKNGHFLAISVTANPTARDEAPALDLKPDYFVVLRPDMTLESDNNTAEASKCLRSSDLLPSGPVLPGPTVSGTVVIDTHLAHGSLILLPEWMGGGWEWTF